MSLLTAWQSTFAFYVDTICDFLMSEPIIYIVCGFLIVFVISLIKRLIGR